MRGEIIGIATPALSRIAGLAIPVATINRVSKQLLEKGFIPRGYLGIGVQSVPLPDDLRNGLAISNKSGLMALTVEADGPAAKAGLLIGDIVIGVGDLLVEQTDNLQTYTDSGVIGQSVKVKFIRAGALKESMLTVGERPGRRD